MIHLISILEKIWENYGVFYVLLIVISLIVLWFIKKELVHIKTSYEEAISNISNTNEEMLKLNRKLEDLVDNVSDMCNLSHCPQFNEINNRLNMFNQDVKEFKTDIKNSLATLTEYAKDRMEVIAKDGKNTNEQLLGLVKTFIDKSFD